MIILILLLYQLERAYTLLNIVGFVALLLLIISPKLLLSIGFQLSVAALIGITVALPYFQKVSEVLISSETISTRFPLSIELQRFVITSIAVTLSASLFTNLIIAWHFQGISLISPIANIIAIPLISLSMILTLCAVSFSFISSFLALLFAGTADILLFIARTINGVFAQLPFASINGNQALLFSIILLVTSAYTVTALRKRQLYFRLIISFMLILLCTLANTLFPLSTVPSDQLQYRVYKREQCNAIIIPTNDSCACVIVYDTRDEQTYPHKDYNLITHLSSTYTSMLILADGVSSFSTVAAIEPAKIQAVITSSLETKHRVLFRALDSLDLHGTPIIILPEKQETIPLVTTTTDSLIWNIRTRSITTR
jgi:ComEC/Rec2-related protein